MRKAAHLIALPVAAWMWASGPHPAAAEPNTTIAAQPAANEDEDEYQGLPPGDGRDEVFGLCGACHSLKLVTQQGLSRQRWDEVLVYMVEEQEMPELDRETNDLVLDYLTKFYGPDRRALEMAR